MSKFTSTDKTLRIPRHQGVTGVLYIRVSDHSQVDNFSIPTQIKYGREYLQNNDIHEVGIFIEEGQSAKTADRTQLQNLLYFLNSNRNKVDFVWVYKIDRWVRSQADFFAIKALLVKTGTQLVSHMEKVDDSPTGKFLQGIFSGLAELDNSLKAERTSACMVTKALDGWYPCKAPYGYLNDKTTKRIIRDENYFLPLQNMLNKFIQGESIPDLASYLNGLGLRTKGWNKTIPREFKPKDVWRILKNSYFYAGFYDWKEHKDINGKHESMITLDQHYQLQTKLLGNKDEPQPIVEDYKIKPQADFELNFSISRGKGFVHCYECGFRLKACYSKGNGGKYPYYYCPNPDCSVEKKSISKGQLEHLFNELVGQLKPSDELLDYFKKKTMKIWQEDVDVFEDNYRRAKRKVEELEAEKAGIIRMNARGQLNEDEFEDQITKIRIEIATTNVVKRENNIDLNQAQVLLDQAESFFVSVEPLYKSANHANRRKLATLLFPQGVSYADGICRTNGKSDLFRYLEHLELEKMGKVCMVTSRGIEPRLPG